MGEAHGAAQCAARERPRARVLQQRRTPQEMWYTPANQTALGRSRARVANCKQSDLTELSKSLAPSSALKLIGKVVRGRWRARAARARA